MDIDRLGLLLVAYAVAAATPARAAEPDFSRLQLLRAGDDVLALAQTRDGLLWVGTNSGLLRFDGHEFRWVDVVPGTRRAATSLLTTDDGALWVGFDGAPTVARLSGHSSRVWGESERVTPGRIRAMVRDGRDGVIVGGDGGAWSIGADGVARRAPWTPTGMGIRAFGRGADGHLWVGTESELGRVRGGVYQTLWPQGPVSALFPLDQKQLLVAVGTRGPGAGLHTLTVENGAIIRAVRLYDERVVRVLAAPTGGDGVWVGTSNGILHVNGAGTEIDHTEVFGGPTPSRAIAALLPDREGRLWMGTPLGMLRASPPPPFRVVAVEGGRQFVSVLAARDGTVWLLGNATLNHFRGNTIGQEIAFDDAQDAPDGMAGMVEDADGALWVGSAYQGLFRYRGGKLQSWPLDRPAGVVGASVRPLLWSTRRGLMVAVGAGSVVFIKDGAQAWQSFGDIGVRSEIVGAAEDASDPEGTLWLVSERHGLLQMARGSARRWSRRDGLPSEDLTSLLFLPRAGLWLGTRDVGLVHKQGERFVALGRREGLGTDAVAGLIGDGRGHLWLTTTGDGVVRVSERDLVEFVAGRARRVRARVLTARDGLPANGGRTRSPPAGAVDSQGRLWLALLRSAVMFEDPATLPAPRLPQPLLDSVRIDGRPLPLSGELPRMPLGQGLFEARYTAALFEGREHLAFRYRLDGVDRDWHDAGDRQEAVYAGLGPGRYRFRVASSFPDRLEHVGAPEATLSFLLVPPFLRTRGFYWGLVGLGGVIVLGAVAMRVRLVRRRSALITEERDRIAREIHDSLEQTLYAAQLQIEAAITDPLPDLTASNLARARALIGRSIEETRAAVWALRTGIFGRADLPTAISVTAGESLRGSRVTFNLETSGMPYRLPAITEWHIGQAVREAFTNAIKHAQPQNLRVKLTFEPARLVVAVMDDGRGFAAEDAESSRAGHYGLRGMKERLRACDGSVTVQSRPGHGTTVRLDVPKPGAATA